jgi:adenine phosphoribosyltransferase
MSATVMTATAQQLEFIKDSIKTIPDYPKPGILFRDVTSLLEVPEAYQATIDLLAPKWWVPKHVASCLAHRLRWRWA